MVAAPEFFPAYTSYVPAATALQVTVEPLAVPVLYTYFTVASEYNATFFPLLDQLVPFLFIVIVAVFAVQFAVYDLSPVDPLAIVTLVCFVDPLLPVQPVNVYPVFVVLFNVIALYVIL